jgi:hypothetical protein
MSLMHAWRRGCLHARFQCVLTISAILLSINPWNMSGSHAAQTSHFNQNPIVRRCDAITAESRCARHCSEKIHREVQQQSLFWAMPALLCPLPPLLRGAVLEDASSKHICTNSVWRKLFAFAHLRGGGTDDVETERGKEAHNTMQGQLYSGLAKLSEARNEADESIPSEAVSWGSDASEWYDPEIEAQTHYSAQRGHEDPANVAVIETPGSGAGATSSTASAVQSGRKRTHKTANAHEGASCTAPSSRAPSPADGGGQLSKRHATDSDGQQQHDGSADAFDARYAADAEAELVERPSERPLGDAPQFALLPNGQREHLVSRHEAKPGAIYASVYHYISILLCVSLYYCIYVSLCYHIYVAFRHEANSGAIHASS